MYWISPRLAAPSRRSSRSWPRTSGSASARNCSRFFASAHRPPATRTPRATFFSNASCCSSITLFSRRRLSICSRADLLGMRDLRVQPLLHLRDLRASRSSRCAGVSRCASTSAPSFSSSPPDPRSPSSSPRPSPPSPPAGPAPHAPPPAPAPPPRGSATNRARPIANPTAAATHPAPPPKHNRGSIHDVLSVHAPEQNASPICAAVHHWVSHDMKRSPAIHAVEFILENWRPHDTSPPDPDRGDGTRPPPRSHPHPRRHQALFRPRLLRHKCHRHRRGGRERRARPLAHRP